MSEAKTVANPKAELEEGVAFAPKFDSDGLIAAVASDAQNGALLMVAHMNSEALAKTLETGEAWYWSRSRGELWHKGATSGTRQKVIEIRIDCDQDAVWLKVMPQKHAGTCHTGRASCFYRAIEADSDGNIFLRHITTPDSIDGGPR
jgi:phosphoribosyl-AMP cyclohydrolase